MRPYSKKRYVVVFILTTFVFVFGLVMGLIIEDMRTAYLSSLTKQQTLDYTSLQLQYIFIDQMGQERNCEAIAKTFDSSVESLGNAQNRLEEYNKEATANKAEFDILKREYTLAQIRYWLLARRTKTLCNMELSTILYFYSTDDKCPDCAEQAFILTYLKKRFKDRLLNFALDADYGKEPMIKILKETYSIEQYPTIVINDNVLRGLTSTEAILSEICRNTGDENCG
ncbi:MAG: hypothetical protein ABIG95_05990 [Candidatus Woesearchaeota archaeon]